LALTLRMTRMGRRKRPFYRIVAMDSRKRRDGRYIESIGYYDPLPNPSVIKVEEELALKWLRVGATLSPAVRTILKQTGVLLKFSLEKSSADEERKAVIIAEWEEANQKRLGKIHDEAAAKQAKLDKAAEKQIKAAAKADEKSTEVAAPVEVAETKEPEPEVKAEEPEAVAVEEPVAESKEEAKAEEPAEDSKKDAE
jgi:small subunit ribosomal protein S16